MTNSFPDRVVLLRAGTPVVYWVCDACSRPSRALSTRRWCTACEWECLEVGKAARRKLAEMAEIPMIDPSATRAV